MRKTLAIAVCLCLLGCTKQTPVEEPAATEEPTVSEPQQTENLQEIEGSVESDLPNSLEIAYGMVNVIFSKRSDYKGDSFSIGDEVIVYYTGNVQSDPVAVKAELRSKK